PWTRCSTTPRAPGWATTAGSARSSPAVTDKPGGGTSRVGRRKKGAPGDQRRPERGGNTERPARGPFDRDDTEDIRSGQHRTTCFVTVLSGEPHLYSAIPTAGHLHCSPSSPSRGTHRLTWISRS